MTTFYHWSDGSTAAYRDGERICHPRVEYFGRDVPAGGMTISEEVLEEARRVKEARFVLYKGNPESYTRFDVTRARWLDAVQVRRAA